MVDIEGIESSPKKVARFGATFAEVANEIEGLLYSRIHVTGGRGSLKYFCVKMNADDD